MIDFKNVDLEDRDIFDKYYMDYNPDVSEMTFTNVFMWRKAFGYKYTIIKDLLCCIAISDYVEPFALTPIGNCNSDYFKEAITKLKIYFLKHGFKLVFKRVSERGLAKFNDNFDDSQIKVEFNRDDSDYVYNISALSNLKGKKYHKKRNHLSRFMKEYGRSYEYVQFENRYLDDCYRIMEEWCKKRNCDEHIVYGCERLANIEVLKNMDKLNCKGALIKVNGKFEAIAVAEKLNDDTVVIHIEKANNEIEGLYVVINRDFLVNQWSDFKFVNREQDLGVEGLRKAKLSYYPDMMVDKYAVTIL